ncbi:MAG: Glycerol-3-phosphate acyltransferase [Anaerolineales bacterium]|nr:Glycerol-3-phosphate acyltransferase [Anaerolineales bacterium]
MEYFSAIAVLIAAYLVGSIPFGLMIVKITTGKDIRKVASGRTGGTNAMRAAGFWAGFATAIFDILKGAAAVWLARLLLPEQTLVHALAPIGAILGHNYSIFLPDYDENGKFKGLRGGAGGAPSIGGAFGLWPASLAIIFPLGVLVFFTIGIASVTTMSVAFLAIVVFVVRAALGLSSWVDVLYAVVAEILLIWALRPNIKNLFAGKERVVPISLYGKWKAKHEARTNSSQS